jgi:parvulin-like peptidyl-prolyl isomerase
LLLAAALLGAAGCRGGGGPEEEKTAVPAPAVEDALVSEDLPDGVVAVVNGKAVTEEQFAADLAAAAFLAKAASFEGRMDVLNGRINTILIVDDARAKNYEERPMIRRMIERHRRRLTVGQVKGSLLPDPGAVSEAEIEAAMGPKGDLLTITALLLGTGEDAVEARARVLAGEDMEALAREVSISPGARTGGARHTVQAGRTHFPPEVEEAIFALPVGEVGEPMSTPVGVLVVRVDERRSLTPEELEKMRFAAKEEVLSNLYRESVEKLLEELRKSSEEKVLLKEVAAISLPDGEGNPAAVWRALEEIEVAEAGGVLLTFGDIVRDVADYNSYLRGTPEGRQEAYESSLRRRFDEVLVARYGRESDLDKKPALEEALEEFAEQVLFAQYGADVVLGVSEKEPSREQVESFFLEHKERYLAPPRLAVAQIVTRRREQADPVLEAVLAGEDFTALAREHSVHPSAAEGGEMGLVKAQDLEREYGEEGVRELLEIARGERMRPVMIRTTAGYHIVVIRDFQDAGEGGLDDVREDLMPDLLDYLRAEAVRETKEALRSAADIRIDEEKVRTVEPLPGGAPGARGPHSGRRANPGSNPGSSSPHGGSMPSSPTGGSPH